MSGAGLPNRDSRGRRARGSVSKARMKIEDIPAPPDLNRQPFRDIRELAADPTLVEHRQFADINELGNLILDPNQRQFRDIGELSLLPELQEQFLPLPTLQDPPEPREIHRRHGRQKGISKTTNTVPGISAGVPELTIRTTSKTSQRISPRLSPLDSPPESDGARDVEPEMQEKVIADGESDHHWADPDPDNQPTPASRHTTKSYRQPTVEEAIDEADEEQISHDDSELGIQPVLQEREPTTEHVASPRPYNKPTVEEIWDEYDDPELLDTILPPVDVASPVPPQRQSRRSAHHDYEASPEARGPPHPIGSPTGPCFSGSEFSTPFETPLLGLSPASTRAPSPNDHIHYDFGDADEPEHLRRIGTENNDQYAHSPTPIPQLHSSRRATVTTDDGGELEDEPVTIQEIMADELLFQALDPWLARQQELEENRNTSESPDPVPPPKRPRTATPAGRNVPIPLPFAPFENDPPTPSSSESGSDSNMSMYENPRNTVTLPEFATMTHHYLGRRHGFTDNANRDLKDFQEGMRKRRETMRAIARNEAIKKGRILAEEQELDFMDEAWMDEILNTCLDEKYEIYTLQIRRAKPLIYEKTGIKVDLIHRCPKGCKAFTKVHQRVCEWCNSPRYKADGVTPTATYPYIRLLPRLRLWMSDPGFLEMMCKYRREAEKEKKELTDFWNGRHFRHLRKKKKLFKDPHQRDMAFLLTTDELSPYKSKAYYRVTPMLLVCYNIPPHLRMKMRFLLVSGFIPGRDKAADCPDGASKPEDRESFFEPLVKELLQLAKGVSCYDSIMKERFTLRGYLVVIGTDMVERADLLGFYGFKGKSFCEYCKQTGLKYGGMYTPTTAPRNAPAYIRNRERRLHRERKAFFDFSATANGIRRNNLAALARGPNHIERCSRYIRENRNDKAFQALHGIRKVSIFAQLESISIPFSFPPDHMHLACNVARLMVEIYNGSIFQRPEVEEPAGVARRGGPNADAPSTSQRKRKRGKRREARESGSDSDSEGVRSEDRTSSPEPEDEDEPIIDALDEPFIIPKDEWERIGRDQERSKSSIPISIGEVDNIFKFMGTMTSASWFSWILHQSLVYFHGLLPPEHFKGYSKFVQAMRLCGQKRLYRHEVDRIESLIHEFVDYFEAEIYKMDIKRIFVWRAIMHQLLHIPDAIRRFGPMYLYSQWTIERYHQRIKRTLQRGVSKPNEHLANIVSEWQCLNSLPFVLPLVGGIAGVNLNSLDGDVYTDEVGNVKLSRLFRDAMVNDDKKVEEFLAQDDQEQMDLDAFVQTDRPWYPRDMEVMLPRARERHPPLPLPQAGSGYDSNSSGSDTNTDDELAIAQGDVFDAIRTDRLLTQPVLSGAFNEIIPNHKTSILTTLRNWDWISDQFRQEPPERQKWLLTSRDHLNAKKWRTMLMVKKFEGLAFMPPLVNVRLTGTESPHWNRRRSNAWVYYRGEDQGRRYGEILFFISALDARAWPFENEIDEHGEEVQVEHPQIHLAAIRRHYPVKVGNCLLRIPEAKARSKLEIVETEAIEDEVGLVHCGKYRYITTRSGGCYIEEDV